MVVDESERYLSRKTFPDTQTFSGSDIMIIFTVPYSSQTTNPAGSIYKVSSEIQTLTISSTTSVLPVRRCGEVRAKYYTRGARSFAGSMVFTITNHDPFKEIFSVDLSKSNDQSFHADQLPNFDIIILANNELGGIGAQIIQNVSIVNWGTTYSVDDMYTEYTYSYVAEHVTPFLATQEDLQQKDNDYKTLARGNRPGNFTPDDLFDRIGETPRLQLPKSVSIRSLDEIRGSILNKTSGINAAYNLTFGNNPGLYVYYTDPGMPSVAQYLTTVTQDLIMYLTPFP